MLVIWNERASPSRERAGASSDVTSRPAKRVVPASGRRSPASWPISVVLPAPFGPARGRLAVLHVEVDPVGRAQAAKTLAEAADGDQRLSHRARPARTGPAWRRGPRRRGRAPG